MSEPHLKRVLARCALVAPLACPAQPSATAIGLSSMEAVGTVGTYPVGLNFTTRNKTELTAAHYFYVSQRKDIPLQGKVERANVEWTGSDGSTFHLHFLGNGSNGSAPLTFYNSIGLEGTWTQGARTLPVKLSFEHSTANPGERLYADVTSLPDADFEAMVSTIQQAILTHNTAALAAHTHFPLRVNGAQRPLILRTAADLDANWSRVFTPNFLAKLKRDIPHEMFTRNGQAMLGDGELWFDGKGLVSVNLVR